MFHPTPRNLSNEEQHEIDQEQAESLREDLAMYRDQLIAPEHRHERVKIARIIRDIRAALSAYRTSNKR